MYPSKASGEDVYLRSDCGPAFSVLGTELSASKAPFNGANQCKSYANRPGFEIPLDEDTGVNKLTNRKDGWFTV